jgi:hypothetical protein
VRPDQALVALVKQRPPVEEAGERVMRGVMGAILRETLELGVSLRVPDRRGKGRRERLQLQLLGFRELDGISES